MGQAAFLVFQFSGAVILARLLTPYDFGVYAVAAATVALLGLLQALGLRNFVIREATLEPQDLATAFTINAVFAIILAALTLGVGVVMHRSSASEAVGLVLMTLSVTPLFAIFDFLPYTRLERDGRFQPLVITSSARQFVVTTVTVVLAYRGHSYLSFAYGQICGLLVATVLVNLFGREFVALKFGLQSWRKVVAYGSHMIVINGVNSVASRLSELIMGRIAGLPMLGLYSRSSMLFNLFWDNLHIVVGRVLFVDLAQRKRSGESLRETYLVIVQITTAALWPAFLGLATLAHPLFYIVYGPKWVEAATPFAILAFSAVIQASITMTWEIFALSGETARQARIEVLRAVVGTAMFAVGSTISLSAAAAARVFDAALSTFLYRPHLERMTDTRFRDVGAIYVQSGVLTLLGIGPALAYSVATRWSPHAPIWHLVLAIAAGVGLWWTGLAVMRHPIQTEAAKIIGQMRRT